MFVGIRRKKYGVVFLFLTGALLTVTGCRNDSGERSTGQPSNGEMQTEVAPSAEEYQPIFVDGLAQNQISNRMEQNLNNILKHIDNVEWAQFPSAGLELYLPKAMEVSTEFNGMGSPDNLANVLLLTNPFSFKEKTTKIVQSTLSSNTSTRLYSKSLKHQGKDGQFIVARESLGNDIFLAKFILAFGDDSFSWIVTATFRQDKESDFGEELLKCVLSTRIPDNPRLPPGQDTDFTINPNVLELTDGFIDKQVFTLDAKFPEGTKQPVFQVVRSFATLGSMEKKPMAISLATPSPSFKYEMYSAIQDVVVDGLEGVELVGIGTDLASGEPLQMYFMILFDSKYSYLMHGWVSSDNPENYIDDFRELAKSFKRKHKDESSGAESKNAEPENG